MASQTKIYDQKKLLGQVYTPPHIVEKILKDTGFYHLNFDQDLVLDPACGDGRFMVPMAQFLIKTSEPNQLKRRLENMHGWDISEEAINQCRQNLTSLVSPLNLEVNWNLLNINALEQRISPEKFDLIVGNPPYIRIQHLPVAQRRFIRETYSFCRSGSTDAYIAFFELASALLTEKGVCGFVTPNSFLNSQTGKPLRSYFGSQQSLIRITNYGTKRLFEKTGTYAAITVFGKQFSEEFIYETSDHEWNYVNRRIPFSELENENQWHLSVNIFAHPIGIKLGDLCQISVGITTLADGFYLFTITEDGGNIVKAVNKNGMAVTIEKALLKPIVKGSTLKNASDPVSEFILFPYQKNDSGKNKIVPEELLQSRYPLTYKYLLSIKKDLQKRDNGKPNRVAWYAFGRSQGLDSSFGTKIVFSPMNRFPNFILYENPECSVYSGYFIKYDGDYQALLEQLNSKRMADFIAVAGRDFQGGYKGYNKKVVENFIITSL